MAHVLVCWVCLWFRGSVEGFTEERNTYICKFTVSDNGLTTNFLHRASNTSSHLRALWIRSQKLRAPVMHTSTVWRQWRKGLWPILPRRYGWNLMMYFSHTDLLSGSIFIELIVRIFTHRYGHRLRKLPSQHSWSIGRSWGKPGSSGLNDVVDMVRDASHQLPRANICHSRIFPNSSSSQRGVSKNSTLAKIREKRAALRDRVPASTI